jgi:hypothetical protein
MLDLLCQMSSSLSVIFLTSARASFNPETPAANQPAPR